MKIGFLVDKINFGGGERILKMLIDEFNKLGHDIIIYTWNTQWRSYENKNNYSINILSFPPIGFKGKILSINALYKSLKQTKPQVLIVFNLALAETAVWSAQLCSIPIITSERVDPLFLPTSRIHRILKKITYNLCNGVVFQTKEVQSYFSQRIQKKSIIIQNPIMDELPPISTNKKKEIIAIGRLSDEKKFDLLIQAFSQISPNNYTLRILGEGPSREKLEKLIKELSMNDKVILEGHVSQVVTHISQAEIFVLCSEHEGMPNALIEAMAMGTACIATNVPSGGVKALIQDGHNGLLIPTNDLNSLKNALERLISNSEERKMLQSEATQIRNRNNKKVIIPQWINFITSISSKNNN